MNRHALVLATVLIGSAGLAHGLPNSNLEPFRGVASPAEMKEPKADTSPQARAADKSPQAPAATTKEAAPLAPTTPPAPAPRTVTPDSANQTDETAGKNADLDKIATSPKDGSPYLGPKEAPVVVNIFSDFQCPVCKRSADPIKQLVIDYPDKVKVVFRNNALEMHGRALPAALAAMAAGKQGKFWQYHDRLFANQRALDDASLRQIAQDLGLDMEQWAKDIADPKNVERVKEESAWANKLGASGTPSLFVNGSRQMGWGSYQGLKSMVAREVASAGGIEASGSKGKGFAAERIRVLADKNSKKEGETPPDQEEWVKILTAD